MASGNYGFEGEVVKKLFKQEKAIDRIESLIVRPVDKIAKLVSNPQAVFALRAQIVLFRTPYSMTISRIHLSGSTTAQQIAGDLKYANDTQSFAGATIIDVCDTTLGVFTVTSGFDVSVIPANKYIYFQLDSSPNAAIKDFYIEFYLSAGS